MPSKAFFLRLDDDRERHVLLHEPRRALLGTIVHASAFGDEMNKSRRMTSLAGRRFADAGFAVMQMDPLGSGDSDGNIEDASWLRWLMDLQAAHAWMAQAFGKDVPAWTWGLRAGCLLACDALMPDKLPAVGPMPRRLLLWQPPVAGQALLQQMLRVRVAAAMHEGSTTRVTVKGLREQLAAGQTIEVGGYAWPPALALGLDAAKLAPAPRASAIDAQGRSDVAQPHGHVAWLEVDPSLAELSPAAQAAVRDFDAAGWSTYTQLVKGPSFWQTAEIECSPELIEASVQALVAQAPDTAQGRVGSTASHIAP